MNEIDILTCATTWSIFVKAALEYLSGLFQSINQLYLKRVIRDSTSTE